MMATYYRQDAGHFHFHDDIVKHVDGEPVRDADGQFVKEETLVHSSEEVAFAYCQLPDRIHVFTHGTAEGMKKWVEAHNSHSPYTASLKFFGADTSAEVVTKAITDHAFFATLL